MLIISFMCYLRNGKYSFLKDNISCTIISGMHLTIASLKRIIEYDFYQIGSSLIFYINTMLLSLTIILISS